MTATKNNSPAGSELVPVAAGENLPAVSADQAQWDADLNALMSEGGYDLPRIGIVREVQQFAMPPTDAMVKTFRGIYLGETRYNILYPPKQDGAEEKKVPPLCVAKDAVNGSQARTIIQVDDKATGEVLGRSVYGKCATCHFYQFGSGPNGEGKACKSKSTIMVWPLGVNAMLPHLVNLSVSSLNFRVTGAPLGISAAGATINSAQGSLRAPRYAIEAEFYLEKMTRGAQVWSALRAKTIGTVSMDEYKQFAEFAKKYMPWLTEKVTESDEEIQTAEVIDDAVGY